MGCRDFAAQDMILRTVHVGNLSTAVFPPCPLPAITAPRARAHVSAKPRSPPSTRTGCTALPHLHRDSAHPMPHLHRDSAHPMPHLHRDSAHPVPHLHRDSAHPVPHLHRDSAAGGCQVQMEELEAIFGACGIIAASKLAGNDASCASLGRARLRARAGARRR